MSEKEPSLSPHFPNSFYRVTVKGLYVKDGKALLVKDETGRSDTDPSPEWELPGGGMDFGESFEQALRREVKEEMGVDVAWVDEKPTYVWTTKHGSGRGMEWYWVLTVTLRFEPASLDFVRSRECAELRFFSKEDLLANVAHFGTQIVPLAEAFDPEDFLPR